jgi:hypothetical protein
VLFESGPAAAFAPASASLYELGAHRLITKSNGPGSHSASVTIPQAGQLGIKNVERPSIPRTIARTTLATGSP